MANLTDKIVPKVTFDYALGELENIYAKKTAFDNLNTQVQGIVETGGEANIVNGVKVNGVVQPINEKIVEITVADPDMSAYSTTEQMNTAISTAVAGANHISRSIVDALPDTGDEKTIYMVLNGKTDGNNVYTEYMWINNKFEIVGSTDIDLSDYVKVQDIELMSVAEARAILYPEP